MRAMSGAVRFWLGGAMVYGLVAACSGSSGDTREAFAGSGGGATMSTSASGGGSCVCTPVPPDVAVEQCDKLVMAGGSDFYAEHAYPGTQVQELADVTVEIFAGGVPGYSTTVTAPLLRDGYAAINCGPGGGKSVTFIRAGH